MTPGQQQRKDAQDEARRQQQADERIRELEKMVKLLAQHAKEAGEIHGIDGQALVDEAEEVLGGKAASITPAVELEEEIDRLRYALQKIKDLPPIDEIHAIAADALRGRGDDHAG